MYYYLIYISKAVKLMKDEDLLAILEESRSWNVAHGITGMLLYTEGRFIQQTEGRFMQLLEGTALEVRRIFAKIKKDNRHRNIFVLTESAIEKRNFDTWSMGFQSIALEAYQELPGFFELNETFLDSETMQSSDSPLHFLKSFYLMSGNEKS